jgi:hypothetical protein
MMRTERLHERLAYVMRVDNSSRENRVGHSVFFFIFGSLFTYQKNSDACGGLRLRRASPAAGLYTSPQSVCRTRHGLLFSFFFFFFSPSLSVFAFLFSLPYSLCSLSSACFP